MRKNTREALEAFHKGERAEPANSIWTDGEALYSYRTMIAVKANDIAIVLNNRQYSVTTSEKQNSTAEYFRSMGYTVHEVQDIPSGLGQPDRDSLIEAAGLDN